MSTSNLDHPAKVKMVEILVSLEDKEEDIIGLFVDIEIFENIFIGGVTGSITIMDSDSQNFIGKNNIEFVEDLSFTFVDCNENEFKFEGHMNGLRNEVTKNQVKLYTIDFTSKAVRKNEMLSVNKAFRDVTPEEIIKEMIEKRLGGEITTGQNSNNGHPMTWVAGNRKPIDVIRYVLNHGVATDGNPQYNENQGTSSGSSGFLCWETLEGYRFCSMDNLLKEGNFNETHKDYANYIANTGGGKDIKSKTIMAYDFPKVGDYFEKLRSGAVKSRHVSFDMDTGIMTNFKYDATTNEVTQKLLDLTEDATRTIVKMFANEKFKKDCQKEVRDTGDQSRMYLSQTIAKQNTFSDTHGRITLPARYDIRAGDLIDIKIYKLKYESTDEQPQEKHSGIYMISQVGNHFFRNGYSYTKLALIRTNIQQDEGTAQS
jgi:hypothetical protein